VECLGHYLYAPAADSHNGIAGPNAPRRRRRARRSARRW
jgi:hypothetical protein